MAAYDIPAVGEKRGKVDGIECDSISPVHLDKWKSVVADGLFFAIGKVVYSRDMQIIENIGYSGKRLGALIPHMAFFSVTPDVIAVRVASLFQIAFQAVGQFLPLFFRQFIECQERNYEREKELVDAGIRNFLQMIMKGEVFLEILAESPGSPFFKCKRTSGIRNRNGITAPV